MNDTHVECPECSHLNSPYRKTCRNCQSTLPIEPPNPVGVVLNMVEMVLNMVFEPRMIVSLFSGLLGGAFVFFLLRTLSSNSGDPEVVITLLSICPLAAAVMTFIFLYSWLNKRRAASTDDTPPETN